MVALPLFFCSGVSDCTGAQKDELGGGDASVLKYFVDRLSMLMNFMRHLRVWNLLEQFKTQYQKHYTNDAEELNDLFKKSKANVVKLNALNHEPDFGTTSMSNGMMIKGKNTIMKERIAINCAVSEIVFQPLHSDTDTSKLDDERIIAVREEPNLHIVFYQKDVPTLEPSLSTWCQRVSAGMYMLCSDKTGTHTQNIMSIESKLLWCET